MYRSITAFLLLFLMASAARSECADANAVCALSQKCIYDTEPQRIDDRTRIVQGIATGNGNLIWQGLEACTKDMSLVSDFQRSTAGCSDPDFVSAAAKGQSNQCANVRRLYCASQESQGLVHRGYMDAGICTGQHVRGAICQCGVFTGQVY